MFSAGDFRHTQTNKWPNCGPILPFFIPIFSLHLLDFSRLPPFCSFLCSSVCPYHYKTLSPQWLGPRKSAWPASSVPSCLPPAKQRSLPFCCRWGGVLRRLRAVIQQRTLPSAPHSEKANSTQGIDAMGEEGRCQCGGCWILGNYKQPFPPRGAEADGAQKEAHHRQT